MLRIAADETVREELSLTLDEICRAGAKRMLAMALEAEVETHLERHRQARDEHGHALVVRNGHALSRQVMTGAGAIEVTAPCLDDARIDPTTGRRAGFRSQILPPWCRRSPKVTEVLPLLYLHGLSTSDFSPALSEFFGSSAGLSAPVITRLAASWSGEHEAFMARDLSGRDYVYVWADGIHFSVRLGEDDRLCVLVILGVRIDGTKELIGIADGYRESTESCSELLRDCKARGMAAPVLAVGDGALGFWSGARDVFPATAHQRDWVHKAAGVLDALPASVQAQARRALREISEAEDKSHVEVAFDVFLRDYDRWPKAVAKLTRDREALLAFYEFPAEHWIHLRTSNPIESTFSSVRARTDVTKGAGSRAAGLAMCFKLLEAAEGRWRRVNAPELVALVRAGAKFVNGRLVERSDREDAA